MKKILVLLAATLFVGSCGKIDIESELQKNSETTVKTKKFKFTVKGEWGDNSFKKAPRANSYLSADGQDMTDLWVLDYMNGTCVQTIHQSVGDESWGEPQMALAYGEHHIYFIASRGDEPVLDLINHKITWATARDTFWKDYEVSVVSTSNGNRAVTLDRVATRLRITATDEVPAGASVVSVLPSVWYYGFDYVSGAATDAEVKERTVNIPISYIGTTGQLTINIFGISGASEWTTDVAIVAKDSDNKIIGEATIIAAPFKRNRSTDYSGPMFGTSGETTVQLNADWEDSYTGTW